jgi:hypothetical protein
MFGNPSNEFSWGAVRMAKKLAKQSQEEVAHSPDRPHGRQPVVIIHGIRDQQPMNTLRDFIKGL